MVGRRMLSLGSLLLGALAFATVALAATARLPVAVPDTGGGGALDWWDTMFVVGVLLAGRRHGKRRPRDRRDER